MATNTGGKVVETSFSMWQGNRSVPAALLGFIAVSSFSTPCTLISSLLIGSWVLIDQCHCRAHQLKYWYELFFLYLNLLLSSCVQFPIFFQHYDATTVICLGQLGRCHLYNESMPCLVPWWWCSSCGTCMLTSGVLFLTSLHACSAVISYGTCIIFQWLARGPYVLSCSVSLVCDWWWCYSHVGRRLHSYSWQFSHCGGWGSHARTCRIPLSLLPNPT